MSKEKNLKVNSILNVIKTISNIVFPLITFPYVSRVLQPENIGKVNFGTSFVSYFSLIATLGITTYAIRECSSVRSDNKKLSQLTSEIFSINICTTIIAYILLGITLLIFKSLTAYRTLIIIQSSVILFTTLGADWLNTAMEDFSYITIRTIVFQILSLILMLTFVKSPDDYMKYAFITVLSSSGANFLNIFYRNKYCKVRFTSCMQLSRHLKPILYLFVMILAQTIFSSADITMLGLMKGDYEVGLYTTAVKVQNVIAQVSSSMVWVMMPRLSKHFGDNNYIAVNDLLRKILALQLVIGLPSIAGVLSLNKEIILIIGGIEYVQASQPLCILMICYMFSLVGGSFLGNMVLLPSGREKTYMIICCISTFINIITNWFLIPLWGINAAACTTTLSSFLIMIMLMITKDKRINIGNLKTLFFSPVVGSIIVILYCYTIKLFITNFKLRIVTCIVGSGIIYVITLLITKNEIVSNLWNGTINKIKQKYNKKWNNI